MGSNDQNLINPDAYCTKHQVLEVAIVGSADLRVALFDDLVAAQDYGNIPEAQWLTRVSTAANGTTFTFLRRGIYLVQACVTLAASSSVKAAISLGATAAQRTTAFDLIEPEVRGFDSALLPAASLATLRPSAVIPVSQADADAGNAVMRLLLATIADGTVVDANIQEDEVYLLISRVADNLA